MSISVEDAIKVKEASEFNEECFENLIAEIDHVIMDHARIGCDIIDIYGSDVPSVYQKEFEDIIPKLKKFYRERRFSVALCNPMKCNDSGAVHGIRLCWTKNRLKRIIKCNNELVITIAMLVAIPIFVIASYYFYTFGI